LIFFEEVKIKENQSFTSLKNLYVNNHAKLAGAGA